MCPFAWASATEQEKCEEFKRLDSKFKTSEKSPLHHDNRCTAH